MGDAVSCIELLSQSLILCIIIYFEETMNRSSFLQKYKDLKNGDTLKFILNEVPENMVISERPIRHYVKIMTEL